MSEDQLIKTAGVYDQYVSDDEDDMDLSGNVDYGQRAPTTQDPRIFKVACKKVCYNSI